jgi:hypothetical protein
VHAKLEKNLLSCPVALYRSWILYYALPVMKGVLSPAYFNHLCLLVSALHILTSDYIRKEKLAEAEQALRQFNVKFSGYMVRIITCTCMHACMCMYDDDIVYSSNQKFYRQITSYGTSGCAFVCMYMHLYMYKCIVSSRSFT